MGGAMNNAVDRVCHGLRTANKTGMSAEFMEATCPGGYDGEGPVEGCMKKGVRGRFRELSPRFQAPLVQQCRQQDLLIWHHWCVHSSSTNRSDRIRQAVIARFHTTRFGEEQLTDAGGAATDNNLWKYWGGDVNDDSVAKL